MDATFPPIPTDPVELVRRLDAGVIRSRLSDIAEERAALLVLLRAALRMERAPGQSRREHRMEAAHA